MQGVLHICDKPGGRLDRWTQWDYAVALTELMEKSVCSTRIAQQQQQQQRRRDLSKSE